ncbi:hypothetical protein [Pseudochrobactrum sp. XF203]|uniref:hypothetical protein n=1 Tax=Pseudochrobactrum sp. XF203 TaxID=2879116 RepID=UPI001CE338C1|nr:hypothetical protein [Pseudochrobactrum sp. XF203]UCA44764.1 hypothetical protein LDL70_10280 [Pseudochrobactrum sp. XF203]
MNKMLTTYILSAVLGFAGTLALTAYSKADEKPRFYYRHSHGAGSGSGTDTDNEQKKERVRVQVSLRDAAIEPIFGGSSNHPVDAGKNMEDHNHARLEYDFKLHLQAEKNANTSEIKELKTSLKICSAVSCSVTKHISLECQNNVCVLSKNTALNPGSNTEFLTLSDSKKTIDQFLNQEVSLEVLSIDSSEYEGLDHIFEISLMKNQKYSRKYVTEWIFSLPWKVTNDVQNRTKVFLNTVQEEVLIKKFAATGDLYYQNLNGSPYIFENEAQKFDHEAYARTVYHD